MGRLRFIIPPSIGIARMFRAIACCLVLPAVLAACGLASQHVVAAAPAKPNIVHIFADDLGWGSVGFNGQQLIKTPHLDALARQGMILNNAYAATVCAPSRSMLYTGKHQGHGPIDRNGAMNPGFPASQVMTPQVLAKAGYDSAIFGKWGFGASGDREIGPGADPQPRIVTPNNLPSAHGFGEFFGYLNHSAAHDYNYDWMWHYDAENDAEPKTVKNDGASSGKPAYSHDLVEAACDKYLREHAGGDAPFYLQICYTIPHFDLEAIAHAPGGLGQYADQDWTFEQKAYAAMISRMDASVGQVLARLEDPDGDGDKSDSVLENTLVIFTSDNGPTPEHKSPIDFFHAAGKYRGGKRDLYEGGIHVPALAYWKGVIEPGSTSDYRTDLADFLPTAAELAGVDPPADVDGVSIVPTLTGHGRQQPRPYLVFEHHEESGKADPDPRAARWAVIRQDGKKLIRYDDGTSDLFDLAADPSEKQPLDAANTENQKLLSELESVAAAEGVDQPTQSNRAKRGRGRRSAESRGPGSGKSTARD
jgi:arylsulfatase A-like enzyme